MKPYFRVTWNVLKYNLIKFFKCKNLKIRGIIQNCRFIKQARYVLEKM